ncbi:MAG: hypothetical protein IKH52_01320 [Bacteroidaceae bacterium]|nr:hypothetical protein [Bacteroidaceae bacterium]
MSNQSFQQKNISHQTSNIFITYNLLLHPETSAELSNCKLSNSIIILWEEHLNIAKPASSNAGATWPKPSPASASR